MRNKKGFTLLELLLVIFIIGILAAAALTTFGPKVREGAYLAEARSNISVIRSACEAYKQQYGTYPTLTQLTGTFISDPNTGKNWTYSVVTPSATAYAVKATKTAEVPANVPNIQIDQSGAETNP